MTENLNSAYEEALWEAVEAMGICKITNGVSPTYAEMDVMAEAAYMYGAQCFI